MELSSMFGPDQLFPAVFHCFSAADGEYLFTNRSMQEPMSSHSVLHGL